MGLCLPPSLSEETLQGFKYFRLLGPLFDHLHRAATERDRAGNRQLFYDQYASLLLLYFFNPVVTSLRGLQQTTTLATVQARLGIRPTSLSALSEAASVFDAALLHEVLTTLGARLRPHLPLAEQAALAQLIAVDGSLLPALPRMAWALWASPKPTVCLSVTSVAANTCGCDSGRIGPTRCALIDAARGDRWRTLQASRTSLAAIRSARSGLVGGSRPASTAAPGGFH